MQQSHVPTYLCMQHVRYPPTDLARCVSVCTDSGMPCVPLPGMHARIRVFLCCAELQGAQTADPTRYHTMPHGPKGPPGHHHHTGHGANQPVSHAPPAASGMPSSLALVQHLITPKQDSGSTAGSNNSGGNQRVRAGQAGAAPPTTNTGRQVAGARGVSWEGECDASRAHACQYADDTRLYQVRATPRRYLPACLGASPASLPRPRRTGMLRCAGGGTRGPTGSA